MEKGVVGEGRKIGRSCKVCWSNIPIQIVLPGAIGLKSGTLVAHEDHIHLLQPGFRTIVMRIGTQVLLVVLFHLLRINRPVTIPISVSVSFQSDLPVLLINFLFTVKEVWFSN